LAHQPPGRPVYAATFLVSAAVLLLELIYTRLFSFSIWYHFAYATISVALLGFGASGALLALFPRVLDADVPRRIAVLASLAALGTIASLAITSATPFDPFRLSTEPRQLLYLGIYYLAVLVPFFLSGACIALVLSAYTTRIGELYFVDLAGAGLGALVAMPLISSLGAPRALLAAAALLALAGTALRARAVLGVAALGVVALAFPFADRIAPRPCPAKTLGHLLTDPAVGVIFSRWNPIARIDVAAWSKADVSREKGLWSIWGRGKDNRLPSPPQYTIAQDADAFTLMYHFTGDFRDLAFLEDHALHIPYLITKEPKVLVIGVGGGTDVLAALKFGARHVTAVDINPVTVSLLTDRFADWLGGVFRDSRVDIHVSEGRHFVRQASDRYDVIQINGVDTLAAMSSGSFVLAESYLYTVEAIRDLFARLSADGLLSIVIMDPLAPDTPPRHMLRLLGVIMEALEGLGVPDPVSHVMVAGAPEDPNTTRVMSYYQPGHRPIMTMELMVKRTPFTAEERARVADFCRRLGFPVWHVPGREPDDIVRPLLAGAEARREYVATFPLAIGATTDDRPFFFTFYRWLDLPHYLRLDPNRATATGQLMLLVMLAQALVFATALIVVPLAIFARQGLRIPGRTGFLAYFASLGVGFIFLEIALIQKFTLFLGYPTRSLSVTLAGLLVSSGVGSLLTTRAAAPFVPGVRRRLLALAVLTVAYVVLLPGLFQALLPAGTAVRVLVALAVLAPLGLVLGSFFPLGIRCLPDPRLVPWAWGINALTTVVGTVLAVIAAMTWGFTVVMAAALAVYGLGVLALGVAPRRAA
jgi:hypothetical protein